MAKIKQQTTLNVSPETLRDLFVVASYYLGSGDIGRAETRAQQREVIRTRGAFDKWIDELTLIIDRGDV